MVDQNAFVSRMLECVAMTLAGLLLLADRFHARWMIDDVISIAGPRQIAGLDLHSISIVV